MRDLILITKETCSQNPTAVFVSLLLVVLAITLKASGYGTSKDLPPGPKGIPILATSPSCLARATSGSPSLHSSPNMVCLDSIDIRYEAELTSQ